MNVKDYFDFNSDIDIRIKGHRIGIEYVLEAYLQGDSPKDILQHYDTLTLEKIYATLLYYHANKEAVEAYLERVRLMDEEAGKLIEAYGKTPLLIDWAEQMEKARQRLIAEGEYPLMPTLASEDTA